MPCGRLTPLGRELARLPVDPRIGRMILAAKEAGCLAEMLVIASALAVPDPRDRPLDKQQAADQAHLRFRDERSDFLSLLALWQFFADALSAKLSHRALVDRCRAHFVSYLRLREWRDLHQQLCEQVRELGWRWTEALPDKVDDARYVAIHKALLAGLLSNVGCKSDEGDPYLGTRGIRFYLHPGSGLAKKGREVGAGGRIDRNDETLRPLRREDRARMDRGGRRRPGRAQLFRSALGQGARRGDRRRARRAVRSHAGGATTRGLRPGRPGGRARSVPARSARRGRARQQRAVSRAQSPAHRRTSRSSSTRRAARTCSSTKRRSSAFYAERDPRQTSIPRPDSSAGASRPSRGTRGCST